MVETSLCIGADPEFLICKKNNNVLEILNADDYIQPENNKEKTEGGYVFYEGLYAELNPYPSNNIRELVNNIRKCIKYVYNKIYDKDILFYPVSSIKFPYNNLKKKNLLDFYTDYCDEEKVVTCPTGGHIHFSIPFDIDFVHFLDTILGVISVALFNDKAEKDRKHFFGHAGNCIVKKHGCEYKVFSSSWLFSPVLAYEVLSLSKYCASCFSDKKGFSDMLSYNFIRDIINNVDEEKAVVFYNNFLKNELDYDFNIFDSFIFNDGQYAFSKYDMLKNWGIIY